MKKILGILVVMLVMMSGIAQKILPVSVMYHVDTTKEIREQSGSIVYNVSEINIPDTVMKPVYHIAESKIIKSTVSTSELGAETIHDLSCGCKIVVGDLNSSNFLYRDVYVQHMCDSDKQYEPKIEYKKALRVKIISCPDNVFLYAAKEPKFGEFNSVIFFDGNINAGDVITLAPEYKLMRNLLDQYSRYFNTVLKFKNSRSGYNDSIIINKTGEYIKHITFFPQDSCLYYDTTYTTNLTCESGKTDAVYDFLFGSYTYKYKLKLKTPDSKKAYWVEVPQSVYNKYYSDDSGLLKSNIEYDDLMKINNTKKINITKNYQQI